VNVATGLLFTDGAKRGISLRGGDVPQNVLNDLVENADLAERSGTSEVALETTQFKLTFKRKAFYSI
jgi:hypothetical protein